MTTTSKQIERIIDQAQMEFLHEQKQLKDAWLLAQTVASQENRRKWVDLLHFQNGQQVLDIGCGFGALSFDIAADMHAQHVQISALDFSEQKIESAKEIQAKIEKKMKENKIEKVDTIQNISFTQGDVYQMPYPNDTFDVIVARFLFQHIAHPDHALAECYRVLRPTGTLCIIDIDDGMSVHFPTNESFHVLHNALVQAQAENGGDRFVGRKIPFYLEEAGFSSIQIKVDTFEQYVTDHRIVELQNLFLEQMFRFSQKNILKFIDPAKFEQHIQQLKNSKQTQFSVGSQFTFTAKK